MDTRRPFRRLDLNHQFWKSTSKFAERYLSLESSQGRTQTRVDAMTKRKDPCAGTSKIKRVRIGKACLISICRSEKHGNALSSCDRLAANRNVFQCIAYRGLHRSVKTKQFADRRGCNS